MRQHILNEIRRLAAAANGKAPGKMLFERETGIREHPWSGSLWARRSDAIVEAGLKKNVLQTRFDTTDVLAKIVDACRYYGRIPSIAEMKLYRIQDRSFPSKSTIAGHFPTREKLIQALTQLAAGNDACSDIAEMLPTLDVKHSKPRAISELREGWVYLLQSGNYYKVGRSDELERRVKSISIALPEAVILVHAIKTDDPADIEAYWHRRFAVHRANGEWFKLGSVDVLAFKRRKDQ